jgi:hypothetical protein
MSTFAGKVGPHHRRDERYTASFGPCKTESSQKPVPVHPLLADALSDWRRQCRYTKPDDWVFASRCYRDGGRTQIHRRTRTL